MLNFAYALSKSTSHNPKLESLGFAFISSPFGSNGNKSSITTDTGSAFIQNLNSKIPDYV